MFNVSLIKLEIEKDKIIKKFVKTKNIVLLIKKVLIK